MVVFTCNHCGDSLQKPRVEKHYVNVCRTIKSLTCMDCLKDFRGEEYVEHTKCVSETQRYAAKGSVIEEVKKGEVKQENWINQIKDIIIKNHSVPINYLTHLEALSNVKNIPRNKEKFMKFMMNSGGRKPHKDDINGLWRFIERHTAKLKNVEEQENRTSKQGWKTRSQIYLQKKNEDAENIQIKQETIEVPLPEHNIINDEINEENDSSVFIKSKQKKFDEGSSTVDEESNKWEQEKSSFNNDLDNSAAKKKNKKKKNSSEFKNSNPKINMNEDVNDIKGKHEIKTIQNQDIVKNFETAKKKGKKRSHASDFFIEENVVIINNNKINADETNLGTKKKINEKMKDENNIQTKNYNTEVDNVESTFSEPFSLQEDTENVQTEQEEINVSLPEYNTIKDEINEETYSSIHRKSKKSKKRKFDEADNKGDEESCKWKESIVNNNLDNSAAIIKKKEKKKNPSEFKSSNTGVKMNEDVNDLKYNQEINAAQNQNIVKNFETTKNKMEKRSDDSDFLIDVNAVISKNNKINIDETNFIAKKKINEKVKAENGIHTEKYNAEVHNVEESKFSESFLLQDKILDVLNSKNSISLSRLQKKVLKAYRKVDNSKPEEKLLKKFNKTLKKLRNVEVNDNIVKLIPV